MDNYDDVLQFVSKVGDGNLNYRSFQNSTVTAGHSKWHLLNEVANYKQPPVEHKSERIVPLAKPAVYLQPEVLAEAVPSPSLDTYHSGAKASSIFSTSFVKPALSTEHNNEASHLAAASFIKAVGANPTAAESSFAHLFRKPQQSGDVKEAAKTDSLSVLFQRIGS